MFGVAVVCVVLAIAGNANSHVLNRRSTDLEKVMREIYGSPASSEPSYLGPQTEKLQTVKVQNEEIDLTKSISDIFGVPSIAGQEESITTENEELIIDPKVLANIFATTPSVTNLDDDSSASIDKEKNKGTNTTVPIFVEDNRFLSESLLTRAFGNKVEEDDIKSEVMARSVKDPPAHNHLKPSEHIHHVHLPKAVQDLQLHILTPTANKSANNHAVSSLILLVVSLCIFPHQYN